MASFDRRWPLRRLTILSALRFVFVLTIWLLTVGMLNEQSMRGSVVEGLRMYVMP
jgi:hypothetical protein